MTWLDGLPTILCEDCGRILPPEAVTWYQGEVAVCKDEEGCIRRKEGLLAVQQKLAELKKEVGDRCMVDTETPGIVEPFPTIHISERNPNQHQDKARRIVLEHYNQNYLPIGEELHISQVFITSFNKDLQNWKAMVATDIADDGMYFEVTYNGNKSETYLDAYVKASNTVIPD